MSETPTPETTTDGPSWSLMVPDDWELTETEGGVELQAKEPLGLLEVSALIRDDRDFIDEDLQELSDEQLGPDAPLVPIECGAFSGFGTAFDSEDTAWKVFLLRAGMQMLFVTYHCPLDADGTEDEQVDLIMETLSLED